MQDGGLGDDCGYSIFTSFESFAALGGIGTIQVVSDARCAWQAVTNQGWITITSPNSGIANGTVGYTIAPNPGTSGRSGTITIAGKISAVKQKGN